MADEKTPDLWSAICERAGFEREPDEVGPPTSIPMVILFAWHPTRDMEQVTTCPLPHATKPTVFEVGKPCPLKKIFVVLAIFEDDATIRIYGLPLDAEGRPVKQAKPEDNVPLRWTLTRTTTTMSVSHFPDPSTFLDTIAAELILAEAELEELEAEDTPPAPAAPAAPALVP